MKIPSWSQILWTHVIMDALGACLTSHIIALRALAATKEQEQEIKRVLINVCSQCADVCWETKYFLFKKYH